MVMSMDTATVDQSMGSPMEDSALSIRHQESADEELNLDEQSKASGQTVVDIAKGQQQPQSSSQHHGQSTQHQETIRQQQQEETEQQIETSAAMILSRESSFNDNEDDDDERKLMMHVDYEPNIAGEQQLARADEQTVARHKFEDRGDLDRKEDPLVARMRDIVEGNQTSSIQCQHHQQHHRHHHIHQHQHQHQPKSSSGDSLNNQAAENNAAKGSIDTSQQKRSRQARHCARHHHHHHHHRPSLGTNIAGAQSVSTGHHHHHHRPMGQQHSHRHHHHHHHQHEHQQQQQQHQADSSEHQTSSAACGKRNSSQRPSGGSDVACQHQAAESSLSQADISKQTSESKSSNSSVSSAIADQQQQQQHETIMSNKSTSEVQVNLEPRDALERGLHHAPTCHHHHHAHQPGTAQHPPHHHHHHHHHHGRHHHHRNHKKRLVLDAGDDTKPIEQQMDNKGQPAEKSEPSVGSELPERHPELVADTSPLADQMRRAPLQEISSQDQNMATSQEAVGSYCAYHEHHCASHHHPRGTVVKPHAHHCHHHHHVEPSQPAKKEFTSGEQLAQHRGHYHHHHHHHRHHHHGQHGKQRNRRHKSSSKTNLDEQQQAQRRSSADLELTATGPQDRAGAQGRDMRPEAGADGDEKNSAYNICDHRNSISGNRTLEKMDQENRMLLDQNEPDQGEKQKSSGDKSNNEVVNMDISPNNDKKHIKMVALAIDGEEKVANLAAGTNSNFIASIEISSAQTKEQPLSNTNEMTQYQQVKGSDYTAQGASSSSSGDAKKQNSSHQFTRSEKGDSIKEKRDKTDQLVRQISMENSSRKEMVSGSGAGASKQQLIECPATQQDAFQQATSQPKQIIESTVSPDRRCRLCWCCCCPCSGLSTKSNSSKVEVKQNVTEAPIATANRCQSISANVPLEKIRLWAESFDRLMKCPDGRRIFQDFLRCEYSEENILFWIACEELKNEKDPKNIATKARDIYEDYISILSAKEVSLDSRVRDIINNNIKKPTSNIFDEAQLQIYTLMHRDSYPRFINSPMYKKLAQIQTSSSRKGST